MKQVEVNVDYVLMLVERYREEHGNGSDRELEALATIRRAIDSRFVDARRDEELTQIIEYEGLDPAETRAFVERAFRDGAIPTAGAAVTAILPPTSRFAGDDGYGLKKQTVLDRLAAFFDRYFALG